MRRVGADMRTSAVLVLIAVGAVIATSAVALSACGGASRPGGSTPALATRDDLAAVLRGSGFEGAFVAWEDDGRSGVCVGGARCTTRYAPASTFKVPHALIALDAGVLSGPDHAMAWDGTKRWLDAWNQDHTLASAIRVSAVWYFQRLAPMIGRDRMQRGLDALGYGNRRIGDALDAFWLDDSLQISPVEQVRFWHRLHADDPAFSAVARSQVLAMTVLARDGDRVLRGKTGWFRLDGHTNRGWLTGCVDGPRRVCFATILFADEPFDHDAFIRARLDTSRALLEALGYTVP